MRIAAGLGLAALFVAALVYATLSESQVECEVCIQFQGQTACRTVSATDRDRAIAMAVSNACAVLANGVTPGIQCSQTPPHSIECTP
jgi:hypothetical protein